MISRCLVFILFCLAATVAKAADVFPSNAEGCDYHLRGQIVSGDAEKLKVLPINSQGITLCLDSPGGSFAEGKRLFDTIWDQDIATMVLRENGANPPVPWLSLAAACGSGQP